MAEPPPSESHHQRRKGTGKRAVSALGDQQAAAAGIGDQLSAAPCGACKFLRRKCVSGCIFAPYFGTDQGAARFAAVHKVFGASNVSKLLLHIPANRRQDAVATVSYEAQARLSDPVYGCVSTILALQQQVASLQAELAMVQSQLMSSRLAVANALQTSYHQQQQNQLGMQLQPPQPAYSTTSSASNNLVNIASFTSHYDTTIATVPSSHSFERPLHLSQPSHLEEEDDEQESHNQLPFSSQIMR